MIFSKKWLVLATALLLVPAYAQDATQEATPDAMTTAEATMEPVILADTITFTSPVAGLQPEGVEWDADNGRFLVGSLTQGTIYSVTPHDDGTADIAPFIEDKDLKSTVGLEIDHVNNRLLVVNSGASAFGGGPGGAGLAAYDLETGERAYLVDFTSLYKSKTHFANDVAVDDEGNAYVTDTFAPVLYKVTPEGEASVLIEDKLLTNPNFGTNGIVYHPNGYLIVANSGDQALVKVTLDSKPTVTPIKLETPLGIDGMVLTTNSVFTDQAAIYAIARDEKNDQYIVTLLIDEERQAAIWGFASKITGDATTITLVGDTPYYINAYLGDMSRTEYELIAFQVEQA